MKFIFFTVLVVTGFMIYPSLSETGQAKKTISPPFVLKENTEKLREVSKRKVLKSSVLLDAPLITQMPELPRGCEVTSLAMMLQYAGVSADKITLAKEIRRDNTPYQEINGTVHFGNPHKGFVGDMYSFENPGLGVYHEPIKELAEKYLPGRIQDISGSEFEEILSFLSDDKPVWVINNIMFDTVPSQYWEKWQTPTGEISITYKEHSVLVTGFDKDSVYFNDPLTGEKNRKVAIDSFKRGWEQMGKQAISYQ